jgi:hypothetical protein
MSEKIKLIRRKENHNFLSYEGKTPRTKASFFKASEKYLQQINQLALQAIKKYPRYKNVADIYYTIALNDKEYGKNKKTLKYLRLAMKNSIPGSMIIYHINVGLAEYYYNHKKYGTAARYYKKVLRNSSDEWLAKHLYNASWCHLKLEQYNLAIKYLEKSYHLGQKSEFISPGPQVLDAMSLFYVHAKRVDDGIKFLIDNRKKDASIYLTKMAKRVANQGTFAAAEKVYAKAHEQATQENNATSLLTVFESKLEFYRNFKRPELFLTTSKQIDQFFKDPKNKKEDNSSLVQKIKEYAGYHQMKLTRNFKTSGNSDYNQEHYQLTLNLFALLRSIDPQDSSWYHFYQAETSFALDKKASAFEHYKLAIKTYEKKQYKEKPQVLIEKVLNAMLAIIEVAPWDKKTVTKNTIYTFAKHCQILPKNQRSQKIFPKLYSLYLKQKRIANSTKVLGRYIKYYPADKKIQQGMVVALINHYVKIKNPKKLAFWVNKLKKGFLNFDKNYINDATVVLGRMLFEKIESMDLQAAKKKLALIHRDQQYPGIIRAEAALKHSVIELELSNTESALIWYNTALKHYTDLEAFKIQKDLYHIGFEFHLLQDFKNSALITQNLNKKFCLKHYPNKETAHIQSIQFQLLENNTKAVITNFKMASKCGVSNNKLTKAMSLITDHYSKHNKLNDFARFYKSIKFPSRYSNQLTNALTILYWRNRFSGHKKTLKYLESKIAALASVNKKTYQEYLKIKQYQNFVSEIPKLSVKSYLPFQRSKEFNPEEFQKNLEYNLSLLQKNTEALDQYLSYKNPGISLKSLHLKEISHNGLSLKLKNFTPEGVPKEYAKEFKKQIEPLITSLEQKVIEIRSSITHLMEKEHVFTSFNHAVLGKGQEKASKTYRYPAAHLVATMDREQGSKK